MSEPLSAESGVRAGELVEQLLRIFPLLVTSITNEDADLIATALDQAEAHLRQRDTFMPLLHANGIGEDKKLASKHANIRIVRAILNLRHAVLDSVAEERANAERADMFAENRRLLMSIVGMDDQS